MFDVLWTDPNRESVGERTLRKEREERERENKVEKNGRHQDEHLSEVKNSSTSDEKGFRIFPSRRQKRASHSPRCDSKATPPTETTLNKTRGSVFAHDVKALIANNDTTALAFGQVKSGDLLPHTQSEAIDALSSNSSRDSGASDYTQVSLAASSTLAGSLSRNSMPAKSENLMQTLGPSSFIIQTTHVIISSRSPESDDNDLGTDIHISSDGIKIVTPPVPRTPREGSACPFEDTESILHRIESPTIASPCSCDESTVLSTFPESCEEDRTETTDGWKPPHEWDCKISREIAPPCTKVISEVSSKKNDSMHFLVPDLPALQRELHMMAAASSELILANIKCTMGDASDAMVYKESEMAKKRWMFSTMHQREKYADFDRSSYEPEAPDSTRPPRILAIYETQASATFLAALHPSITIAHISPHPISPERLPNVKPIPVPTVSSSAASRILPPLMYTSVTCLSMPALFPSTEVPIFLRQINRCLARGGALHLTLIDPQPESASMGPRLRQWLIDKLLINLERDCRTTLPSHTFPAWLAVSRLRGKGSTISTMSVPAVHEGLGKGFQGQRKSAVDSEVKCLLMRMLWQEVWGSFVHADRWWWEEHDIVEECREYGTFWKYSHIVAVKEHRFNP